MSEPQNDLERALWAVVKKPDAQPELLRLLRESFITFLTPYHPEALGDFRLENLSALNISTWNSDDGEEVPLFTSMARASAALRAVNMGENTYCLGEMKGDALFAMLAGQSMGAVLNPACGTPHMRLGIPAIRFLANMPEG